jgi:hypothetical protein
MSYMKSTYLYNLSGRAVPDNAEISVSGSPRPDDVLIIDAVDGSKGTARWQSRAELAQRRAESAAEAAITSERPSWAAPLKPKAPYT